MRIHLLTLALISGLTSVSVAQSRKPSPSQRRAPRAQAPAQQAPQQAPQQSPQQSTGYYAAPPRSGTYAGGSSSVGVEGMALHFPAMSLKMPTLQLPSLFSLRSPPKVMMDPALAPFVEQQQPVGVGAPMAIQAQMPANVNRAPDVNRSPVQRNLQKQAAMDARDREIAELRARIVELVHRLEGHHVANRQPQRPATLAHPLSQSRPAQLRLPPIEDEAGKLERLENQVQLLQAAILKLAEAQQGKLSPAAHLTPVPARQVAARLTSPRPATLAAPVPAPLPSQSRMILRMPPVSRN